MVLIIFALALAQEEKPRDTIDPNTQELPRETFDPNTLVEPEPKWPLIIDNVLDRPSPVEQLFESDSNQFIREGYRVQVLATRWVEKADSLRGDLLERFGGEVYVIFEAPNYKVRVGNYIDRRKAEAGRDELVRMGYKTAWIIRTRIEPYRPDLKEDD